jgi:hypothetical protein
VAKQTGPLHAVKKKQRLLHRGLFAAAGLAALAVTSGCASTWSHPRREGAEAAADERECSQRAEENALQRRGRERADYRLGTPDPNPGMSRGETPMQMLDRRETQDDFGRDFENCMTSKGYSKG